MSFRVTLARQAIIEAFENAHKPLSAPELLDMLHRKDLKVNKTTVYREIAFLLSKGLVREISLSPKLTHYESTNLHHHHHLVCKNCGSVDEIVCEELERPMQQLEKRVAKKFRIKEHSLEFFGLCAACS